MQLLATSSALVVSIAVCGFAQATESTGDDRNEIEVDWRAKQRHEDGHVMRSERELYRKPRMHSSPLEMGLDSHPDAALVELEARASTSVGSASKRSQSKGPPVTDNPLTALVMGSGKDKTNPTTCPFTMSTGSRSMLCMDSSLCNPLTSQNGWGCCTAHGGRKKCPAQTPLMCHWTTCNDDYCCDSSCELYGGLRRCEVCDETAHGFRDGAYRGCQTITRSGRTCQRWDAQAPHAHNKTAALYPLADMRENFCRNPTNELTIWCYTTDSEDSWEFCDPMPSFTSFGGEPQCGVALPLVGTRNFSHVIDKHISVSSFHDHGTDEMWRARLDNIEAPWSAVPTDPNPWIQWDFGSPKMIQKIQTKGRADSGSEWVVQYKLAFSPDGDTWTMLDPVFEGNQDRDSVSENTLDPPVVASMLRLFPIKFHEAIGLRADLFGCSAPQQLAVAYRNSECCSGSDCDESIQLPNYVSWSTCHDECQKNEECLGFQFGKDLPDPETDRCTGPNYCACWLITGACPDMAANKAYDAFLFHVPTIPVRLMSHEGQSYKGRLEIYHNGEWGSVCSTAFSKKNAFVICGMQGLLGGEIMKTGSFPTGSGPIWMDNVQCHGKEKVVWRCGFSGWGNHNCDHLTDVGIECSEPIIPGPPGQPGRPGLPGVVDSSMAGQPGVAGHRGFVGPPGEQGDAMKGAPGEPGDYLPPISFETYMSTSLFIGLFFLSGLITIVLYIAGHTLFSGKRSKKSKSRGYPQGGYGEY